MINRANNPHSEACNPRSIRYIEALGLMIRIIIMSDFSWMLTPARHYIKCFAFIMCFVQSSFLRGRSWDSEKLSDLFKVTHLISGQAEVQIQLSNLRPYTHDHDHSRHHLKVLPSKWQQVAQDTKASKDTHAWVTSQHNRYSITFMLSICFTDRKLKYKIVGLKYKTETAQFYLQVGCIVWGVNYVTQGSHCSAGL